MLSIFTILLAIQIQTTNDLQFVRAVEESILREGPVKLPAYMRMEISKLGNTYWKVREKHTVILTEYFKENSGEVRWLFHPLGDDLEIRYRCQYILRRVFPCDYCKGQGYFGDGDWSTECIKCHYSKSLWLESIFK